MLTPYEDQKPTLTLLEQIAVWASHTLYAYQDVAACSVGVTLAVLLLLALPWD